MLKLYTAATPNGWKISVLLEELGIDYEVRPINLTANEQKSPEYLAINPNGRIPAIIDTETDMTIFESGAIMIYLAEKHKRFLPEDIPGRTMVIQWLMFQISGIGPMMGQANVFFRYFPKKIPEAIERYQNEVKRLFTVLDGHLNDREYLAGDYSIADMANWCWVHTHNWSGVEISSFKNLKRWNDQIGQRPAIIKGIQIPAKVSKADIKKAGQQLIK
ncbi:MAG: glutathione S-transferase N-terminal domain-containing protein [Marinicella sp.]|nr:glutathione S-transferase N-terminal domain-containing protein [Xanthomonadales bacterium]